MLKHSYDEEFWESVGESKSLRRAVVFSLILHIVAAVMLAQAAYHKRNDFVISIGGDVGYLGPVNPEGDGNPLPPSPTPPTPEPPPPAPEAPKEPPKAEPPKPPEPPKVEEKKPDPPKPEPSPKHKEEAKKEKEPDKPKEPAENKEKSSKKTTTAAKATGNTAKNAKPTTNPQGGSQQPVEGPTGTGVTVQAGFPSELSGWGRLAVKKIEKYWQVPAGVLIDPKNNQAEVSFWIDHEGNLIGQPEIVKEASDPEVGQSGIQAILLSAPLPPLPPEFTKQELEVVYVFTVVQ